MIDLYYWPTPNGQKVTILLEEAGVPYNVVPVDIGRGAQFEPGFLAVSPNNRMPAIVDHDPADGGPPLSIFESGAILQYLAEKTGQLQPVDARGRAAVNEWLHWQMSGLGPMSGQCYHFHVYAPEPVPYAKTRYLNEVRRLYGVMERRLSAVDHLAGDYSIADIACYPWMLGAAAVGIDLAADFPAVQRWVERLRARPAVQRGMAVGKNLRRPLDEEARKHLFERKT
jgi:GST-like protein